MNLWKPELVHSFSCSLIRLFTVSKTFSSLHISCNKNFRNKVIMMEMFFICMPEYKSSDAELLLQKGEKEPENN